MSDSIISVGRRAGGSTGRLALGSLRAVRSAFSRVARGFWRGDLEDSRARTMCYLLTGLLSAFAAEQGADLEGRVSKLEKAAKGAI